MKINCHCHIFSLDCVPLEYRDRFLLNSSSPKHRLVHRLLKIVLPEDTKVKELLDLTSMTISEIAWRLINEMDEAGIEMCTPLMMDMEYCEKFGGGTKRFEDQLTETKAVAEEINRQYRRVRMIPFVAADPNRRDMLNIVMEALNGEVFGGVKIYPVMGFTPDDKRLYPLYDFCDKSRIPITAHCENGGIPGLSEYYHLAHPKFWDRVLREFKTLTLNLAHNDRTGSSWQKAIAELILSYPNVYTDVSYDTEMLFMPRRYFRNIKRMLNTPKLRDHLLYGTDWYMGRSFWTESSYLKWFEEFSGKIPWCRVEFSNEDINRLTYKNPMRFLGLKG